MARLSQMSAFQFTIFSLLSSFTLILVSGENLGFHSTLTHVRLYWHDIVGGSHPSAIEVVPAPSNKSQTNFGLVRMFDNALTEGPELSSKLVARAQGFYGFAGQVELSLLMAQNFAFVNSILNKVRELPVIGGSGAFRFARGYAELRTHTFNLTSSDAIVEYNIYVLHY
ncbi:dirigent protein 22-like [Pyrus ussuriensis x Pyrus communis]|uniref:Dirigent protein n=1 Tax=Pyrus ussuriensis x Pyrus communis TaxID=2448454 RepID=A0A5N5G149_9ROSA|nr:dirigent protein 22-like [Pyrus ussuriensis x Pyrus communis]